MADNAGTIRMGMIGAGWIAQDHKRVLGSLAEAELVAVCDLDSERAEALASGTGARTYQDWRELLDHEDLGAVIVCVPPQAHREPAVAALGRGLPVYLEKPIARTAEDAAEIVAAAKSTGTVCAVGYQWHALDLLGDLPPLLAGQQIGLLLGTSIGPTQSRPWFVDMRAGGGNLLERGSHHLDLARTVAGEVASVQTAAGRVRLARSGGEGGDIDDALTMMLELTSGALATIVVAWTKPGQPGRYGLDIVASDATLRLALDPDFTLTGLSAGQPVDKRAASQPMERSMSRFLRAVSERDPAAVVCTPPDAAATLAVAIAAERALETSRAVPVERVLTGSGGPSPRRPAAPSARGPAAVAGEHRPGQEAGIGPEQEGDHPGHVLGAPGPAEQDAPRRPGGLAGRQLGVAAGGAEHRRVDRARADAVDQDALGRVVHRHGAGEADDPRLGRRVGGAARPADQAVLGAHGDDPAAAAGPQQRERRPADVEGAGQVHRQRAGPVRRAGLADVAGVPADPGHVDHAR